MPEEEIRSTQSSVTIDANHELFLAQAENPNHCLATKLLNGQNFEGWKRSMEISLSAKNKLGFVNGLCKEPDETSPLRSQWKRCNDMVISWIIHSVEDNIAQSVMYYKYAYEIWDELCLRYAQSSGPKIYQIEQSLNNLSQDTLSVTEYFTRLKSLWDEYDALVKLPMCSCNNCSCGVNNAIKKMIQDQRVIKFLMGLDDGYKTLRGNILMLSPLPGISKAFQILLQDEAQKNVHSVVQMSSNSSALMSHNGKPSGNNGNRFRNGPNNYEFPRNQERNMEYSRDSNRRTMTGNNFDRRSRYFCDHCKVNWHSTERCYKLHGRPDFGKGDYKGKRMAANIASGNDEPPSMNAMITPEMYKQLVELLNKQSNQSAGSNSTSASESSSTVNTTFLAGPFDEGPPIAW